MKIIPHDDYALIRSSLCSDTPKMIKTGIQEMLHLLENGLLFLKIDKVRQLDFHSYVYEILQNSDFDIRKWMYHLLCVYDDPIDMSRLIDAAITNVEIESQQSIENISWIVAVCGAHAHSKQEFDDYLKKGNIFDYLDGTSIELASASFRERPFTDINNKLLLSAINPDDCISPIWITKIYANQYNYFKNNSCYNENHGQISGDVLADLLHHPGDVIRKYSMWAYAQDINTWRTPVRLENTFGLETGVLKWCLVNLFQNSTFLQSHLDFIEEVAGKLKHMKSADKEGIILGCKKMGYCDQVSDLLVDWVQAPWETNENLLIGLYSYFARFSNKNSDYYEITKSAINNMNDLPNNLQEFYKKFQKTKEGEQFMDQHTNNFYGNTQVVYGGQGTQIINEGSSSLRDELLNEIQKTQAMLEQKELSTDEKFEDFKNHLVYELKSQNSIKDWINEIPQIQEVLDKLDAINQSNKKSRKAAIGDFLSALSNVVTILSATQSCPQIIEFFRNIITKFAELFG